MVPHDSAAIVRHCACSRLSSACAASARAAATGEATGATAAGNTAAGTAETPGTPSGGFFVSMDTDFALPIGIIAYAGIKCNMLPGRLYNVSNINFLIYATLVA